MSGYEHGSEELTEGQNRYYTPTTEEVRELVVAGHENQYRDELGQLTGVSYGIEFDRWLAEVKAQVWEEGFHAKWYDYSEKPEQGNPYRGAKQVSDHQGKVSFTPSSIIYCCSEHMSQATKGVNNGNTA